MRLLFKCYAPYFRITKLGDLKKKKKKRKKFPATDFNGFQLIMIKTVIC